MQQHGPVMVIALLETRIVQYIQFITPITIKFYFAATLLAINECNTINYSAVRSYSCSILSYRPCPRIANLNSCKHITVRIAHHILAQLWMPPYGSVRPVTTT